MTFDGYGYIATHETRPSLRIEATALEYFKKDSKGRLLRNDATGDLVDGKAVAITARVGLEEKPFFEKWFNADDVFCAQGREIETLLTIAAQMIDELAAAWERNGYKVSRLTELKASTSRRPKRRGHGPRWI